MNLVFFGAPGAGKGSVAKALSSNYNLIHISTGDLFRDAITKKSELGVKAKKFLDNGTLVTDELTNSLVEERLSQPDLKGNGFILDGYPRNIAQAFALKDIVSKLNLPISKVVFFNIDKEILIDRIVNRRTCSKCGTIYNLNSKEFAPKVADKCDKDGETLNHRKDDTKELLEARLSVYEKETFPLYNFYKAEKLLLKVNASKPVDKIVKKIVKKAGKK